MSESTDLTPQQQLEEKNCHISKLLDHEELDASALLQLVQEREQLVRQLLDTLPDTEKKTFIQNELQLNEQLASKSKVLFNQVEQSLSNFVRSKKAAGKYTK